jgi:hypothetical protein
LIWVDDIIVGSRDTEIILTFKRRISRAFKIKDLGPLRWILGMEVHRDRARRTIRVTQQSYIQEMLKDYGMEDSKPVSTPTEGKLRRLEGGQPVKEYMQIVGSILYAAIVTRPDIAYAAQALGRHLQSTGEEHIKGAKRVLRYLKGTSQIGLTFSGGKDQQQPLMGYCDSDWGGDEDTSRSTTGYIFIFGGGPVSWNSRLQPTVALSSSEAEYMALCAAVQEAVHLRQLLNDLGFGQIGPTTIREDNQSCIAMARNPVKHGRTKHIDIKYHFVREKVADDTIRLEYIPTGSQVADMLTKGIPRTQLSIIRNLVMGKE